MTMYFTVIFWNVTILKFDFLRTLCCYQEDVGLSVGLHQPNCIEMYCYVEPYEPILARSSNLGL